MAYRKFGDFAAGVSEALWERTVAGDEEARRLIAESLDGVDLYFHAGPDMGEGSIWVTVADLLCHGIIRRITLHKGE